MKTPLFISLLLPVSVLVGCEPPEADNANANDADLAELQTQLDNLSGMQSQIDDLQEQVVELQAQVATNASRSARRRAAVEDSGEPDSGRAYSGPSERLQNHRQPPWPTALQCCWAIGC